MPFPHLPRRQIAVVGVLAIVIGGGVYAYTASNTVPSGNAGSGSGAISGYTVSNVSYGLNATTPTNLDQVTFTIAPVAASSVKAQLAAGGTWYSCTNAAGSVTCNCVLGGGGNDSITGGSGTDVCIGGPGIDTFTTCETQIQ